MNDDPDRRPDPGNEERMRERAARVRAQEQHRWVDLQVQRAIERGDFDNLPGAGKPIDLSDRHDPDWWVKRLIEREQITDVLPEALQLRKDDLRLDGLLDREPTEALVRRRVAEFNARIVEARRQLQGGPPVVTPTRDPDDEVRRWRERRQERRARAPRPALPPKPRRRWFRRR